MAASLRRTAARLPRLAAPIQCTVDSRAAFSTNPAAIATAAAAADPPAGTGWLEPRAEKNFASPGSGVAQLTLAPVDELLQRFVYPGVDAGIGELGQQLLPLAGRHLVDGPGTLAVPAVEVVGRGDPRPVKAGAVVAQRVLAAQEVAARADLADRVHRLALLVDRE